MAPVSSSCRDSDVFPAGHKQNDAVTGSLCAPSLVEIASTVPEEWAALMSEMKEKYKMVVKDFV